MSRASWRVDPAPLEADDSVEATDPQADAYPWNLGVVKALQASPLSFHPQVTYLVGDNGSGKSTLLEALAVAWGFNAEGGSLNFRFATRATHGPLHRHLRLARGLARPRDGFFLRAETFYNVASEIDRLDEDPSSGSPLREAYGGRSLHSLSHGEAFWALLHHRFKGPGLYMLDEPEAALSAARQCAVLERLQALVSAGSQFIIATHSPILLAHPGALIYRCGNDGIHAIDYRDSQAYTVTRDFLASLENRRVPSAPPSDA